MVPAPFGADTCILGAFGAVDLWPSNSAANLSQRSYNNIFISLLP
jgi:hypothetical protein